MDLIPLLKLFADFEFDAAADPPPQGASCTIEAFPSGTVVLGLSGRGGTGYRVAISPEEADAIAALLIETAQAARDLATEYTGAN